MIEAAPAPTTRISKERERIAAYPRLSRFYGFSFTELATMPRVAMAVYIDALDGLVAEEHLREIEAMSMPYYEDEDRTRLIRMWQRIATDGSDEPEAVDLRGVEAIGIKVQHEGGE